jgi:hypothetical protein
MIFDFFLLKSEITSAVVLMCTKSPLIEYSQYIRAEMKDDLAISGRSPTEGVRHHKYREAVCVTDMGEQFPGLARRY